jgi:Ca-activated chloride channel family protein
LIVTKNATEERFYLSRVIFKANELNILYSKPAMKLAYILPAIALLTGTVGTVALQPPQTKLPAVRISQTNPSNTPANQPDNPPGGLFVLSNEGKQQVFPLKHTDVKAKIAGNVSRVEVTQTFENPFKEPLEAVYVFPLPDEAAVDDMEIKIGERIIKGDIKKREEAQKIYEQAVREGRTAGLLEQERDNIFTQSLANIKPGEKIDVTIRYTDSLKFEGGNYEFVFPMVVGPRYIAGNPISPNGDTERVPDASRITPPVLKPGARSGHDINVTVEIDAGIPIKQVQSTSHKIRTERTGSLTKVQLAQEDNIPNKDLILRYQVAGKNTQATVLTQTDNRGSHFAVYLIPAVDYKSNEIVPKDVVFLMDTSGSQSGDPLVKSKELMRRFINGLNPNDTFTIIDFANTTTQLSPAPLANTPANRQKAMAYIEQLDANGGTELLNGIRAVLNFPAAKEGRLRSVVLITDGYIGNENEVIAEVQGGLKSGNRLYSFGVGSSVNRFLLDRLAEVGRGTSQVIRQDEPTEEVAEKFFRQINNPVLTNIQVNWEGEGKPDLYPSAVPDLFAQQPLVLFGRKQDGSKGQLKITGTAAGGKRYEKTLNVDFAGTGNPGIAQLWGRSRIKDLMNQMFAGETKSGVEAVTDTALSYRLLSQYTAFVAVSEEVRVNPDGTRQRVQVPVELPDGVSYEGIFGRDEADSMGTAAASPAPSSAPRQMNRLPGSPSGADVAISAAPPELESRTSPLETDNFSQNVGRIEIISAQGLDQSAIASLTQYLQSVNLPQGVTGEIVLEFPVKNGRVGRIILDDKASTLQDMTVINQIKQALAGWSAPSSVAGNIRLKLRVN